MIGTAVGPTARALLTGFAVAMLSAPRADAQGAAPIRPAEAYARLDSLERAALAGATFAERLSAVSTITQIGIGTTPCHSDAAKAPLVYRGLVARLRSIYRQSADTDLRQAILGKMLWHGECEEAVQFLTEVAAEPPPPPAPPVPGGYITDGVRATDAAYAIAMLNQLGPAGQAALRQLRAANAVRDPQALRGLEEAERRGYRRPRD